MSIIINGRPQGCPRTQVRKERKGELNPTFDVQDKFKNIPKMSLTRWNTEIDNVTKH